MIEPEDGFAGYLADEHLAGLDGEVPEPRITVAEAVRRLDAIDGSDGEHAHAEADEVLAQFVPTEIVEAMDRLIDRAAFWAYA